MWVANTQDDTVSRIDPRSAAVTQTIPVGARPTGIAAGDGAVWVANSLGGTVSRIDPEANQVEATIEVGEAPQGSHDRARSGLGQRPGRAPRPRTHLRSRSARTSRGWWCPWTPGRPDPALLASRSTPARLRDQRAPLQLPRPPLPQGLAAGSRGGGGGAARLGSRPDLPVQDPAGVPLLAALERARDRRGLRARAGARSQPRDARVVRAVRRQRHRRRRRLPAGRTKDPRRRERARADAGHPADAAGAEPARTARDASVLRGPAGHADRAEGVDLVPSAGPYYVDSYAPGQRPACCAEIPTTEGSDRRGWRRSGTSSASRHERGVEEVEAGRADYVNLQPDGATPCSHRWRGGSRRATAPAARRRDAGHQQLFTQTGPAVYFLRLQHPPRPVHGPPAAQGGELRDRPPLAGARTPRSARQADRPTSTSPRVSRGSTTQRSTRWTGRI